ncbi:hypothetical protein LCGC14_2048980 [marine sediment metagenome]|uniref:Uncharacterized protein n=1 Tax=marine sediment metagenome TaxID=412755 RepID=A0A0F9FC43_9ZZZZ
MQIKNKLERLETRLFHAEACSTSAMEKLAFWRRKVVALKEEIKQERGKKT